MKLTIPVSDYVKATGKKQVMPLYVKQFAEVRGRIRKSWIDMLGVEGDDIVIEFSPPRWFTDHQGVAS